MVPNPRLLNFWSFLETGANGPCCTEIKAAGGKAVADYNSVVNGDKIVETAVKAFGTVHILLNNAGIVPTDYYVTTHQIGILRDVSFKNMKDSDWDLIWDVHVKGSYKV